MGTDKLDYAPGETALVSASGFQMGEAVRFQVLHTDSVPNTGRGHDPWSVTDGGPQDLDEAANGKVLTSWYVDPDDSAGSAFSVTATGQSSHLVAQNTFTDSPVFGTTTTNSSSSGRSSATFSHAVPAGGVDRLLVVSVMTNGSTDVSSITYGGVNLTQAREQDSGSSGGNAVEIWYLAGPATGIANVVVTFSGSVDPSYIAATNFTNVNQASPIGATNGANATSGTAISTNLTTTTAGSVIFGAAAAHGGDTAPFAPGAGTTESWDANTGANADSDIGAWGGTENAPTAGVYTFNATSSASDDWAIAAIEIKANNVAGAPQVASISRNNNEANTAATVSWTVAFNEGVNGVDASDFALVTTGGINGASITSVTGSGSSWVVTANTGSGNGSLKLNLVDNDTIKDLDQTLSLGGNGQGNGNFAGPTYLIAKNNPALPNACGVDMVLVLDVSGSIDDTEYSQMVSAITDFVNAFDPLENTQIALVAFNGSGAVVQGFTDDGSEIIDALTPRPNPGTQFTNWDVGLYLARNLYPAQNAIGDRNTIPDLIVFASDGNPNRIGGHASGLGHPGTVQEVATPQATLVAVEEAIAAKSAGIRILGVGIGTDLNVANMQAITGNNVSPPAPVDKTTDVIVSNFDTLGDNLRELANSLCPVTVSGHKWNDLDGDSQWDNGEPGVQGWTIYLDNDFNLGNGVIATTTTNSNGEYHFDNNGEGYPLGTYTVYEGNVAGWTPTYGGAGYTLVACGCSGSDHFVGEFGAGSEDATHAVGNFGNMQNNPALNITKTATVPGGTANVAGEIISYTITVQNTGNVTLTGVVVSDPYINPGSLVRGADAPGDGDAQLEIGETWTYTAIHTVTQAEIDSNGGGDGILENVATADSTQTPPDNDDANVPVARTPTLNITKNATVPGGTANVAGENISYSITVQNTGNTTLTGVVVSDPYANPGSLARGADVTGDNDTQLEVGETWSYTAIHTVTQAEIDSNGGGDGVLENVATADSTQTPPDIDDANVPVTRTPELNITKNATVPGGTANVVGENISYTITVQNTGNTTLTGVVVTDPYVNPGSLVRGLDATGDNDTQLEVGETWSYTAIHTVTRAEIDSNGGGDGVLENVATADSNETGPDNDDANVPIAQGSALNITKNATVPGGTADAAGEIISYTITVQNTGNTTLTGVVVTDPYANPGSLVRGADAPGDGDAQLEVGETWTYTAIHTVTQAEIDSNGGGDGILENVATADSTQTPPDNDDANVPVARTPALNITKNATVPGGTANVAGENISYSITVQNTGNTTLTGVVVSDPYANPGSLVRGADVTGDNDPQLEVGETWSYTAIHTVTQAEIDSNGGGDGVLENVATADSTQTDPDTDDANVPVARSASLNITKSATVPGGTANVAGEDISYTITVQNTGNTTLTGVVVTDPYINAGSLVRGADATGDNDAQLEVGETWTYTAKHTVTQLEIDTNGGGNSLLENTATTDSDQTGPDSDDADVPVQRSPAINIIKDAFVTDGSLDTAGELIHYTIVIQNLGNVTLDGSNVSDDRVTNLTRVADVIGDNDALFEVGESWMFTASIAVTQDQLDAGLIIRNIATVTTFQTPPDDDDADVPVTQIPGILVVKEVNGNDANTPPGVSVSTGSTVNFTFDVSNFGNAALSNVTLTDNTVSPVPVLIGGFNSGDLDQDNQLDVTEIWHYTATATAQAGQHTNTATVTGTTSGGETSTDTDDGNYFGVTAAIDIEKFVNGQDADVAPGPTLTNGSTAVFTYVVRNTGNVPLANIVVVDDNGTPGNPADDFNPTFTGGDTIANGLLDAGETWTYTASRIVTAGPYINIGRVTASDPSTATTASDSDAANYLGQSTIIVVTPDKTNASLPFVHLVELETGNRIRRFQAYELAYRGGVRVATGDLNGDGVDEIVVAPGRGRAPMVKVFDQLGNLKTSFLAYASTFTGGVEVAVADVNGDGKNDIVTAMSYNGNQVKVFRNASAGAVPYSSLSFPLFSAFEPFGSAFKGGATIDAADLGNAITVGATKTLSSTNFNLNRAEIVVGNGSGMRSTVKVYTYFGINNAAANNAAVLVRTFLPFSAAYKGGVSLDLARVDADLVPDLIVSVGNGGGSQVQVLDGDSPGAVLKSFTPYSSASSAPVHTVAVDRDGNGIVDFILTAQGTDGVSRKIRRINSDLPSPTVVDAIFETHPDFAGAYFLATLKRSVPRLA